MSRTLSAIALRELFAQHSGDPLLMLLEISTDSESLPVAVPGVGNPIRLVDNPEPITHLGNVYAASSFELNLPNDSENVPRVTLRVVNVLREYTEWVRSLTGAPVVSFWCVLASQPDVIDVGPYRLEMRECSYDAMFLEGELVAQSFLNEPFPSWTITPQRFPAMY